MAFVQDKKLFEEGGIFGPKDAWDKLSIPEKAEMMKVAIKNGIYDLPTIRKKYNEFAEGGEENPMNYEHRGTIFDDGLKRQGITHVAELPEVTVTGRDLRKPYRSSFTFNPTNMWQLLLPDDANRLYNTVDPNRPYGPIATFFDYHLGSNNRKSITNSLLDNKEIVTPSDNVFYNAPEAALAMYLGLGDKEFQTKSIIKDDKISNYFQPAEYLPTKGSTYSHTYKLVHPEGINTLQTEEYDIPFLNDYIFAQMVDRNNGKPVNTLASSLKDVGITPNIFEIRGVKFREGTHALNNVTGDDYTIGLGHDSKGSYLSYYDEYDLNAGIFGDHKTGDIGLSISNPFSLYDRKYYSKKDSTNIMNAYRLYGETAFDKFGKLKTEYE